MCRETLALVKLGKGRVQKKRQASAPLQALMVAAFALPGLFVSPAFAAEEEASFQYGHYQEGKRQLYQSKSQFNPIEVDTLQGSAKVTLVDRLKFAFNYTQDTWSGATPITTAPSVRDGNRLRDDNNVNAGASPLIQSTPGIFDKHFNPLKLSDPQNPDSKVVGVDKQLVHTLSYASPETRKQADFKLNYEWEKAAINVGGGLSLENDYESRFGNVGGRWDFNKKLTSVSAGVSYTNSHTQALLDHDAYDYYTFGTFPLGSKIQSQADGSHLLQANKQDWAVNLGLTQILNKNAVLNLSLGYTYSSGFMENPYKAVTFMFVDPSATLRADGNYDGYYAVLREQRPNERNQWTANLRYAHNINSLDAALHADYRFFHDDWGINAHTFELDWAQPLGEGWTITPRLRYYSQSAADFYQPVFLSKQALPEEGKLNPQTLPNNYSSDHRLSGYGTLSGGLTLAKQIGKGINLELGFEYYSHAGSLKLGGGGEASYADFNYYVANAALNVNLGALANTQLGHHHHHSQHSGHHRPAPAGVMFDHSLHKAGDTMVGYRYMYSNQAGATLRGDGVASDLDIAHLGCKNHPCATTPTEMAMHMHMLDLMYAPTDWLTLMLMPQFVDMSMDMRQVKGDQQDPNPHIHSGGHTTGGIGDTGIYALGTLFERPGHRINLSLGVSAPTGDVGIKLRDAHKLGDVFIHYGMQLGSGTWDFKPTITYTGELDRWSWGLQLSGTKRLESKNASGFAFGDIFQSTVWGGYQVTHWLSASLRGVYTVQGTVKGEFNGPHLGDGGIGFDGTPRSWGGTEDVTGNYGGRFWDVGVGLTAAIPDGSLQGNQLSFEWLQPVHTDFNGYQVDRDATLSLSWSYMF